MGLFKMSTGSIDNSMPLPKGNPNPYNYKVLRSIVVGKHIVVEVNYPDCTNFEGNKILLFESSKKFDKLRKQGSLDPHFIKNASATLVARFEPTERGWELAIKCAELF